MRLGKPSWRWVFKSLPKQAWIVKTHRPFASRVAPLFALCASWLQRGEERQGRAWLAKRGAVLQKHPQARLQGAFAKKAPSFAQRMHPCDSGVLFRVISCVSWLRQLPNPFTSALADELSKTPCHSILACPRRFWRSLCCKFC